MALDLKGQPVNDLCALTIAQKRADAFLRNLWPVIIILVSNERPADARVMTFVKMLTVMIVIMENAKKVMCTIHPGKRIIGLDVYVMRVILVSLLSNHVY